MSKSKNFSLVALFLFSMPLANAEIELDLAPIRESCNAELLRRDNENHTQLNALLNLQSQVDAINTARAAAQPELDALAQNFRQNFFRLLSNSEKEQWQNFPLLVARAEQLLRPGLNPENLHNLNRFALRLARSNLLGGEARQQALVAQALSQTLGREISPGDFRAVQATHLLNSITRHFLSALSWKRSLALTAADLVF
jgi:hypothetical protein